MSARTTVIAITIFTTALFLLSGPASVAEKGDWTVNDIKIGNRSQFSKSGNQTKAKKLDSTKEGQIAKSGRKKTNQITGRPQARAFRGDRLKIPLEAHR